VVTGKIDPLMTPEEVAAYLRVRIETVYRYIKRGELAAVRIGRGDRVRPGELEEFLRRGSPTSAERHHDETAEPAGEIVVAPLVGLPASV
jgi:excisionase family DNA binding protein